jgi:hypothetical protein
MPVEILKTPLLLCCLGTIQLLGLISAAVVRLSEGSPQQTAWHRAFLACLGLVGVSTILSSMGAAAGYWISSGTTLSVMVIAATCDFGRSADPAA